MNYPIKANSEAAFVLASVMEFLHVWRSGDEASLSLQCKEGKTVLNFQVSLGSPDRPHFQHGRSRRVVKKSARRVEKDRARAAAHRAARAAPALQQPPAPLQQLPGLSPPQLPPLQLSLHHHPVRATLQWTVASGNRQNLTKQE